MTMAGTEFLAARRADWPRVRFGEIADRVTVRVEPTETDAEVYGGMDAWAANASRFADAKERRNLLVTFGQNYDGRG